MKKLFCILILLAGFAVFSFSDSTRHNYVNRGHNAGYGGFLNDYYIHNISCCLFYSDYNNFYYDKYNKDAANARKTIEILEAKKAQKQDAEKKLSKISVVSAKFYKKYTTDKIPQSIAEITLENASDYSLKKLYFRGILKTHITNKLIIDEFFNYEISGVQEPSEMATYKIPLNAFGGWSKAKAPDLAVFTVTLEGLESRRGRKVQKGSFTPSDEKLLEKLKKEYGY